MSKALKAFESYHGRDHINYVRTATALGLSYLEFGERIDSSFYFLDLAYEPVAKQAVSSEWVPVTYFAIAQNLLSKREHQKGLGFVDRALVIANRHDTKDKLLLAKCYSLKGNFLKKQGRFKEAQQHIRKAIQLAGSIEPIPLRQQQFYNDLMMNTLAMKDTAQFLIQLDSFQNRYSSDSYGYGFPNRLLGRYHFDHGEYEQTIHYYSTFLKEYEASNNRDRKLLDETFYALPVAYAGVGEFAYARDIIVKEILYDTDFQGQEVAFEDLLGPPFNEQPYIFVSYGQLAKLLTKEFELSYTDFSLLEKSFSIYKYIDQRIFEDIGTVDEDVKLQFLEAVGADVFAEAVKTMYYLYQQERNQIYLEWANTFVDRSKSSVLFSGFIQDPSTLHPEVPDSLIDIEKNLKATVNEFKLQQLHASHILDPSSSANGLSALEGLQELLRIYREEFPGYYQDRFLHDIPSIADVQEALNDDCEKVVQYSLTKKDLMILFISKSSTQIHKIPLAENFIELVNVFKAQMQNKQLGNIRQSLLFGADSLYRVLIHPFTASLEEEDKLIIIPDGALLQLPFELLLTRRPDLQNKSFKYAALPYLIKSFEVQYAHSLKGWLYRHQYQYSPHSSTNILAYTFTGDDQTTFDQLPELTHSAQLLALLGSLFSNKTNRLLSGEEATLNDFMRQCEASFEIIHLGLHAESSLENRLENKIYFRAGPGAGLDTLFGYQVLPLDIQANLVVLAACETAMGANMVGEGTYSLARSFLEAGAKQLVATTWEVDDRYTAKVLSGFYQHLSRLVMDHSKALRMAKLEYLQQVEKDLQAHPKFWAGIVCY